MSDPIYLINGHQKAVTMAPAAYAKEEEFQEVLERFPELLAGEQIDRDEPRRWLHVAREIGIPDTEGAGARWQLDHFFVDQDCVPTLVEMKRQSDTRLRREVLGQVLDYAANANRYWSAAYLRDQFNKTCERKELAADEALKSFLGADGPEPEEFWSRVHRKLHDGDMRLMFVADKVPTELQSIVEFLNNQMSKTEVLAVEVTRYVGGGFSTHIPRLLGQTAEALDAKAGTRATRRKWDADQFFAAASSQPAAVVEALRKVYALARGEGFDFRWGTGTTFGSLNVAIPAVCPRSIVTVQTNGIMKPNFGWLPDDIRDRLGTFAQSTLGLTLEQGWQQKYIEVPSDVWVPAVDALVSFVRSLKPE